jgi:hypothetical protein
MGLFLSLLVLASFSAAQDKIYRSEHKLMDDVHLTAKQKKQIDKVDATYGPKMQAIMDKEQATGKNLTVDLDMLNRRYSRALLDVMTESQKKTYMVGVYHQVEDFVDSHPGHGSR